MAVGDTSSNKRTSTGEKRGRDPEAATIAVLGCAFIRSATELVVYDMPKIDEFFIGLRFAV